jgi:DNA-binding transcriptional LysR family regulator
VDLDGIAVFVKVVQAGSFSAAARLLGIPNTTVSAKVARLEKRLGVTLIQRTTRKLNITPAGRAYFERCLRGLEEIETAEAEVSLSAAEPRGLLRVTAPGDVAMGMLPPIVSRFLKRYPRTRVEIVVANRVIDLVAEGVHLAIRAAGLPDSTLAARRFMPFCGALWASRAYLERRGAPKIPLELEQHDCLVFPRFFGAAAAAHRRAQPGRHRLEGTSRRGRPANVAQFRSAGRWYRDAARFPRARYEAGAGAAEVDMDKRRIVFRLSGTALRARQCARVHRHRARRAQPRRLIVLVTGGKDARGLVFDLPAT